MLLLSYSAGSSSPVGKVRVRRAYNRSRGPWMADCLWSKSTMQVLCWSPSEWRTVHLLGLWRWKYNHPGQRGIFLTNADTSGSCWPISAARLCLLWKLYIDSPRSQAFLFPRPRSSSVWKSITKLFSNPICKSYQQTCTTSQQYRRKHCCSQRAHVVCTTHV